MTITYEHTPKTGVRFHPLAELFPWIEGDAMQRLRDDIQANGVREPIVFMGDAIIDGRNRYMCARDLGIEYPRREFGSDPRDGSDPVAFVLSVNLHRRHLSDSQRAGVAAKLANMKHGDIERFSQDANLHLGENKVTTSAAAEMLNVSERSVASARKVHDKGAPELVSALDRGQASVAAAATISELPKEEQAAVVAQGPKAIKERAKQVREAKAEAKPERETQADAPPLEPTEEPADAKARRAIAKLTREALEDDVLGLRADLADAKAKLRELKAENANLKGRLRDLESTDQGEVIRRLQAEVRSAGSEKWRQTELHGEAMKQVYALKKRVAELEAADANQMIPLN